MRTALWAALGAVGISVVLGATAWAQSLPLPSGSYRSSCSDARATAQRGGKLLEARCRTSNGRAESATLRYENCRGDIANMNGQLVCNITAPAPNPGGQTPAGSYRSTCSNTMMDGPVLSASCRDSRGGTVRSSLDTRNCGGRDIANLDGRLTCAGGGGGQIPSGSFRETCTDLAMNAQILTASCRDTRGQRARSTLDVRTCNGRDIANINGRLTCSAPAPQLPAGSYGKSCSNAMMDGSVLSASCRDSSGKTVRSSLDVRNCDRRDIANIDGRLTCAGGGGGQIPIGSYNQTCTDLSMTSQILSASCKDGRGNRVRSTLDVRTCGARDIANVNGRLTCGAGNGGVVPPSQGSITFYPQNRFEGRGVTIDRATPRLGPDINDRARSVQIRGNGRWVVCVDAEYRGRCQTLTSDQPNLRNLGLDGRITSVRPAR